MSTPQIVLATLFAGACLYTILGYPKQYGALSGRSRLFRTLGMFLLDLLIGLVLLYTFLDRGPGGITGRADALRSLLYLGSCIFLAFGLVCLALLDALETLSAFRRQRRQTIEEFVKDEVERARVRKEATSDGGFPTRSDSEADRGSDSSPSA